MVRTAREIMAAGDVPTATSYLDPKDKEVLAEAGTVFEVTSCQMGEGTDYGGFWEVEIAIDGEYKAMQMGCHARRDGFMNWLAVHTADAPVGGLVLVAKSKKAGNSFLVIEPAPESNVS